MRAALLLVLLVAATAHAGLTARQIRRAQCIIDCGPNSSAAIRRRCLFSDSACPQKQCDTTTTTTTSSTTTTRCPCLSTTTTTAVPWNWTQGRDGTDPADTDTLDW